MVKVKLSKEVLEQAQAELKEKMMPLFLMINDYAIPAGKEEEVIGYTVNLFSNHQNWKFPKVTRKVVEHFKLHLKPVE